MTKRISTKRVLFLLAIIVCLTLVVLVGILPQIKKSQTDTSDTVDGHAYCQAVNNPACYAPEDRKKYFGD